MPTTPLPVPPVPPAPYGGYALRGVRRAGGEETPRFEAVLTLHGEPVAQVSNGGHGGSHRYQPLAPDRWAATADLVAYATTWNAGNELAGYEDQDQLINRLLEVDRLSRMRSTPFVLDMDDPWAEDADFLYLRGASREETIALLRSAPYAERRPRIWDKAQSDFMPVA